MIPFDVISDAVHDLSYEDKIKLRTLLDEEIKSSTLVNGEQLHCKRIIGLFSDEPELIDEVMQSAYERRSRPLRSEE